MTAHLIGYDLKGKPGVDYTELEKAIKDIGNWWHCLDSTWLVVSNLTDMQIATMLQPHLRANDKLLVAKLEKPTGAWVGMDQQCQDWLKANLS